ncbi:MAG: MaoC family dehydratase N-terminal domain-containing protein, partial [Desulfobacterales bacterium]|nr:MaoC family dehydratase N-terminal domain-containing protein [Desulfobacterales bacterium]
MKKIDHFAGVLPVELDARLIGTPLSPHAVSVPWRKTTAYAAGIGEDNPLYFDDTQPQGLVAPPIFPVTLTWPMISRLGEFIQAPEFPREVLFTQVHYSEHLILHRLVRPGDELTIDGVISAILPHRAGTHAVVRFTARDQGGAVVFVEYIGAMLRGVTCKGEGQILDLPDDLAPISGSDGGTAPPPWETSMDVDPLAPYIYDACADI